jgi:hypothetical protein
MQPTLRTMQASVEPDKPPLVVVAVMYRPRGTDTSGHYFDEVGGTK